jgi:hypothetical protein
MEKFYQTLHEIEFGSSDPQISRAIRQRLEKQEIRSLGRHLYTSNMIDPPEVIVRRNWGLILGYLFPGALLSHRSALQGGPGDTHTIFLTYTYSRKILLPGLTVHLLMGPPHLPSDPPFLSHLYRSSDARALLENMQVSRKQGADKKVLEKETIEKYLEKICRIHGVNALNALRDQAKESASALGMEKEWTKLNSLFGAILGTHKDKEQLVSKEAKARSIGKPYDPNRVILFEKLFHELKKNVFIDRPEKGGESGWKNAAFFDAYFSNFIEGTQFTIEEAHQITFEDKIIKHRRNDSHDVRATFEISSNRYKMQQIPENFEQFIELLKNRHEFMMHERQEISPGEFKEENNRAGQTVFVKPELLLGTLEQGFTYYQQLSDPFSRAAFMMFLVSETHPFNDGNGRIARIMMNAELIHHHKTRIFIPIVYREDYLLALRVLSRQGHPHAYLKMLDRAHALVYALQFDNYENVTLALTECNAFIEPSEGLLKFPPGLHVDFSTFE